MSSWNLKKENVMRLQLDKIEVVDFKRGVPIFIKDTVLELLSNKKGKLVSHAKYIGIRDEYLKAITDGLIPKAAYFKIGDTECYAVYPFLWFFSNRERLKDRYLKKSVPRYSTEYLRELKSMGF